MRREHLFVIYPGSKTYPLQEKITAVPLSQMADCRRIISPQGAA